MEKLRENSVEQREPINITLDKVNTPIAYGNKIKELVEQGLYEDIESAEQDYPQFKIDCEIYYQKHSGVFAVESSAVESDIIYSPYTCDWLDEPIID